MPAQIDFLDEYAQLKQRREAGETREALTAELERRLQGLIWNEPRWSEQPEAEVIEDLLDCLTGFCSPHMAL